MIRAVGWFYLIISVQMAFGSTCLSSSKPVFKNDWQKEQFERGVLYELQYRSLDKASIGIADYLTLLNKDSDTDTYINQFVDSQCSRNRTSLGQKKLKSWMKRGTNLKISLLESIEIENLLAIKLNVIKSLCSWAGNLYEADSMAPFINDAQIISWFITEVQRSNKSMRCEGIFCRMGEKLTTSPALSGGFFYKEAQNYLCSLSEKSELKAKSFAKSLGMSKDSG